jgi:hypothetical protein
MLLALVIFSAFIAYRLRTTELPDRDIVSDGDRDYKHLWRVIPKAPPVEPPVAEKDSKPFFTERDEAVLTGIRRAKPLTPEILRFESRPLDSCGPDLNFSNFLSFWEDNPPPPASNVPNYTFTYDLIIKNQFPSSCEGKKFLMYSIGQSGIGSDMHIISWGLAVAMDSNRIFVRTILNAPGHSQRGCRLTQRCASRCTSRTSRGDGQIRISVNFQRLQTATSFR